MYINRALLKHRHSNFSLEILEYCKAEDLLTREDFYFKLLKPQYNLLTEPGSPLGRKQSEEAKAKISAFQASNPQAKSVKIEVQDLETGITTLYNSINEAARALNICPSRIVKYFVQNQKKGYKKRYIFQKSINSTDEDEPPLFHCLLSSEDLKALHSVYIRELYKDREAPVKPFDRDLILATCFHCLDKEKRSEFLKE